MFKNIFIIIISFSFFSCKTYFLSTDEFKNQFPLVKKDSINSIYCKSRFGKTIKIDVSHHYKILVTYKKGNHFWQNSRRTILNPKQIFFNEFGIVTDEPFTSGIFQTNHGKQIFFNSIEHIEIKNFSDYDNKISLKFSPFPLINPYDGYSFRLGIECKLFKNISTYIEGGNYFSYVSKGLASNAHGIVINPELRYYLNKNFQTTGRYMALDYSYKNQKFNWSDTVTVLQSGVVNKYNKDYIVHKIVNSIGIKYGSLRIYNKKFIIDYFFGLGIQFKNTSSSLSQEEQGSIRHTGDYSLTELKSVVGKYTYPNLSAGIKIGFRLN